MTIKYFQDIEQGSDEWYELRCGVLTASNMKLVLTPTLKIANNDKSRAHAFELLAQRITKYVEPQYISDDMIRGQEDEILARAKYAEHYAPVQEMGFVVNDEWGFIIGYSPDGLVGDDGLIEIKSRRAKYQIETILTGQVPEEYMLQIQTGLLVTGRKWCDFISYCGGMQMVTIRVEPNPEMLSAILAAATGFETDLRAKMDSYNKILKSNARLLPTERRVEQEIIL